MAERLAARRTPSTPRPPKRSDSRETVRAILEAGERLMAAGGAESLRMTDVGKVAGVAPSTLYEYFPSKDALVHALEEAAWAAQVALLIGKLDEVNPLEFEDAARTMMEFAFDAFIARGQLHGMTTPSKGSHSGRQLLVENVVTAVAGTISPEVRVARVRPYDVELALHVLTRVVPLMAWIGLRDFSHRLPDWRREVVDMCVGYFVKGPRAA